jgi:SAM-dependent methyltransferase
MERCLIKIGFCQGTIHGELAMNFAKFAAPWWVKLLAKLALSHLPVNYRVWQRLGVFRHGRMDHHVYLINVFNGHLKRAGYENGISGKTILELGPGDSVGTALVAASHGARAIMLDAGAYAVQDIEFYRGLAGELMRLGLSPPDLSQASSLEEVLRACNAIYLTQGLTSFSEVDTASVDLIFSHAVLEHVRRHEFAQTMRECLRVLVTSGAASHRVDLEDHLGGGLNNLRFSHRVWESPSFVNSGFYTNRLRCFEMIDAFRGAGFGIEFLACNRYPELPISRQALNVEFTNWSDEELMIRGFTVVLKPDPQLSPG